jgi:hypothetical protein
MADGYTGLHARNRAFVSDGAVDIPKGLVSGLRAFASGHGGATAVIEYAGRRGAKIVLVGSDGAAAEDQYVASTEAARAACERAGISVEHEWERELTEQMSTVTDLWSNRRVMSR